MSPFPPDPLSNPTVSVVMPVYNVAEFVVASVHSVLRQTFRDFELIIVDDGGTDESVAICRAIRDMRIRIVSQDNRGLAGARNTGIRHARGRYVAFLDSDDLWTPEKLDRHVAHLDANPHIGVSFSGSRLIDDAGVALGVAQRPRLHGVTAAHIFRRNPVGNGSAPVIRRETLDAIAFTDPRHGELAYFDEGFRQSEDIECWMRIALTTSWRFEGVAGELTQYRVNAGGLSANIIRQYETWLAVTHKIAGYAPEFLQRHLPAARAYQLRYLARRAVRMREAGLAASLSLQALKSWPGILIEEPVKTTTTLAAAAALRLTPRPVYEALERAVMPEARRAA